MANRFRAIREGISAWLNKLSAFVHPDAGKASNLISLHDAPLLEGAVIPDECGNAIFDAGWRQGSFIDVNTVALPDKFIDKSDVPYVMVCSQSCTTVSPNFVRDPYVEFIIARPIDQYNPRCPEATGKNMRKLHLQAREGAGCPALELSINDRFELSRSYLLSSTPLSSMALAADEEKKLTNWLAKNYSRIALPNALVGVLRKCFFSDFEKWLKTMIEDRGQRLHCYIDNIFISWKPDDESGDYTVKLIIIADDEEVQSKFEKDYLLKVQHLMEDNEFGLKFTVMSCMLKDEVFLSDLEGYARFSAYDYFTSLDEWHQLSVVS